MKKIIILIVASASTFFATEYKHDCKIPNILIETIKLTENLSSYPYLIRTNERKTIEKFYSIASNYEYKKTKDEMVINCKNESSCVKISYDLISSGITNIDLGLFQINYNSYPYNTRVYFDNTNSYRAACAAVIDKVKNRKRWDWETLASYHSATPHLNKIYKDKLIANYIKLTKN